MVQLGKLVNIYKGGPNNSIKNTNLSFTTYIFLVTCVQNNLICEIITFKNICHIVTGTFRSQSRVQRSFMYATVYFCVGHYVLSVKRLCFSACDRPMARKRVLPKAQLLRLPLTAPLAECAQTSNIDSNTLTLFR